MTALLSEIFLFLIRAASKLRSTFYGPKRTWHRHSCMPFCALITRTTRKLKVVPQHFTYQTIAVLSEISILLVKAVCEIPSATYGSKHASKPPCGMSFCAYLHSKLQVGCGRSTYRMIALLWQLSIFRNRA